MYGHSVDVTETLFAKFLIKLLIGLLLQLQEFKVACIYGHSVDVTESHSVDVTETLFCMLTS